MEINGEVLLEPVTPTGHSFNSSSMSVSILGVLEFEIPFDDSLSVPLITTLFLPVNPLFSSLMVNDKDGKKKWKRVRVNPEDHFFVPTFPSNLSLETYDAYFNEYMTKLALEPLSQTKPLWEIHLLNFPTSNAACNVIFKLHHSLGDGYSLMSALLSCLKRADNPSLPLTFPSTKGSMQSDFVKDSGIMSRVSKLLFSTFNTVLDFGWSLSKSTVVEDDSTPIRSGADDVQFKPIEVSTMTVSLQEIKAIKAKLKVTVNDVLCGMIFYGIRLYMQVTNPNSIRSNSTGLVVLNTRMLESYKPIEEMFKPNSGAEWGNRMAFLHISIPKVTDFQLSNPIEFIKEAQKLIMRKKNSSATFLTAKLLEMLNKLRGPEGGARHVFRTLKNSSTVISNLIGPVEKMTLSDNPVKGLYFAVAGAPVSLAISMVSYMGNVRIAFGSEKEFIDQQKLKSCMEKAFEKMQKAIFDVSI